MDKTGRNKWVRRIIEFLVIMAVIFAARAYQHRDLRTGSAPSLQGVLLDGTSFNLAEFNGRPVLVHFWATWCAICKLEQGTIAAIARDHRVITVAMRSGVKYEVKRHLSENGLEFPVLNDQDGRRAASWGVNGVPTSFIVDGEGKIRFAEMGYTTEAGLRARLWLAR